MISAINFHQVLDLIKYGSIVKLCSHIKRKYNALVGLVVEKMKGEIHYNSFEKEEQKNKEQAMRDC